MDREFRQTPGGRWVRPLDYGDTPPLGQTPVDQKGCEKVVSPVPPPQIGSSSKAAPLFRAPRGNRGKFTRKKAPAATKRVTIVGAADRTPPRKTKGVEIKCGHLVSPVNKQLLDAIERRREAAEQPLSLAKELFSTPSPLRRQRQREQQAARRRDDAREKRLQLTPTKFKGAERVQHIIDQAKQGYRYEGFDTFSIDTVERHLAELGLDVDRDLDEAGDLFASTGADVTPHDEGADSCDEDSDSCSASCSSEDEGGLPPQLALRERPPPPVWM